MLVSFPVEVFHGNSTWFRLTQFRSLLQAELRKGRENLKARVLIDRRPLRTIIMRREIMLFIRFINKASGWSKPGSLREEGRDPPSRIRFP